MRRIRRTRLRTSAGGTDRRRRHRFPVVVKDPDLHHPSLHHRADFEEYLPLGDVDALLWEHAEALAAAVSER